MSVKHQWPIAKFKDVTTLITDGTHHSPETFSSGDYLYLTSKNIRKNYLDLSNIAYVNESVHREIYKRCPVKRGDVLLTKDGANTGLAAENTLEQEFSLLSSVALLRPAPDRLDSRYLVHWINSPMGQNQIVQNMSGSAIRRLILAEINKKPIPLPPLSEQKRIADILDKADAIRRKRQEAVEFHETLLSAAFDHCVGQAAEGHDKWTQTTLGNLADFIGGSSLPTGIPFEDQKDGLLLVKVGDMNLPGNDIRISTAREWIDSAGSKYAFCPRNAIVIPKRGGAIGTNKKRLLDRDGLLDPNLMGIVPKIDAYAAWLFQWFQHFDLLRLVSGSAVPQLNKKDLAPLEIIEPPLDNLIHFEKVTESIRDSQNLAMNAANEANDLFNSLVQRAFKGEL